MIDLEPLEAKASIPAQWEIERRVLQVTAEQCDLSLDSLSPQSRLIEDLNIDSLEVVELIIGLEEEFGVTIPDAAAQTVFTESPVTLRALAVLVREQWNTGTATREEWQRERPSPPAADTVPFTQLGGHCSPNEWRWGPLYDPIGRNREGYQEFLRHTDGMRCVLIPAADTWIGTDLAASIPDQRPMHTVRLGAFLIDAEPVSNTAFARFLNSVGDLPPSVLAEWCGVEANDKRREQFPLKHGRRGWEPIPGTERQPMILVSWYGANAYSLWANRRDWRYYRGDGETSAELSGVEVKADPSPEDWMYSHLPSEAQWEYAARGGETPHAPPGTAGVLGLHAIGNAYSADTLPTAPVNERRGMSPFGLHHMSGNVWQWCRDWYSPDFYQRPQAREDDPQNAQATGIRSERGGSWVGPAELGVPWLRRGRPPLARGRCLGFRCVGVPEELSSRELQ